MRESTDFTHEEYELAKVVLEREDVPAEALALLSAWIEGEWACLTFPETRKLEIISSLVRRPLDSDT
jgi:hypothetical protein